VQSEALVMSARRGDDGRLAHLIGGTDEFERVARARIFIDTFPRSPLRPKILLALGDAATEAAEQLTREATRRFERREIPTDGAPEFSYYLNYNGLDRYNRQGVTFTFDREKKQFHYDGAAWREILRKYPNSPEAIEAAKRLENLRH
jgi:outer membrane protein assembly factor BamD (BamD/ComL family)